MKTKQKSKLVVGDAVEVLKDYPDTFDCCVTSPPYGDMREYKGYEFEAASMLQAIQRSLKDGGICVWVIGDVTTDYNRELIPFQHGLLAQNIGFKVLDVMIYAKKGAPFPRKRAYSNIVEYMLILLKGDKPKTFNPLRVKSKLGLKTNVGRTHRRKDGSMEEPREFRLVQEHKIRENIWTYSVGARNTTKDRFAYAHPAMFPEKLAEDHILSWTNKGDIVLDPMCGSGTTCKMAMKHGRRFMGIDIASDYIDIARQRLRLTKQRMRRNENQLF